VVPAFRTGDHARASPERNGFHGISSRAPVFHYRCRSLPAPLHLSWCRKAEKVIDSNKKRRTMSNDTITVTGLVATTPRLISTVEGLSLVVPGG
jgi:hypothetical protein